MELDEALARIEELTKQRKKIDAQLAELVNVGAKRGRPKKPEQQPQEQTPPQQ